MEPILKVTDLGMTLDQKVLFHHLNFELNSGEILAILGPNGVGKTVLLRALLGLIPSQGQIAWKKGITRAYIPQRIPLQKDLPITIKDFFTLKKVNPQSVMNLLQSVGIHSCDILDQQLGLLSSGQFQRVLIAWALSQNPDILLLDEPTAGVDVGGENTIYSHLSQTQKERNFSMLLITHDLNLVHRLATRVLYFNSETSGYGHPREILRPEILNKLYEGKTHDFQHTHP